MSPVGAIVIALYLLAAHMTGDFIVQNRFMAVMKTKDRAVLLGHVSTYALPFVPVVLLVAWGRPWWHAAGFLAGLLALHYLTDRQRFRSTAGDVLAWWFPARSVDDDGDLGRWHREVWQDRIDLPGSDVTEMPETLLWPPPNEWPAMPLMIDQTLHVVQLAVLAALFLR